MNFLPFMVGMNTQTTQSITGEMSRRRDEEGRSAARHKAASPRSSSRSKSPSSHPGAKVTKDRSVGISGKSTGRDAEAEFVAKKNRARSIAFEKERDGVQPLAYKVAQGVQSEPEQRELLEKVDEILKAEVLTEGKSPFARDALIRGFSSDRYLERSAAPRMVALKAGGISSDENRREALVLLEAHRMSHHMQDKVVGDAAKQFTDAARLDDRRVDPKLLQENMTNFLTTGLQFCRKDCLDRGDRDGATFANAALRHLGKSEGKPPSLRTLATIAHRAAGLAGGHSEDAAKPFVAAQFALLKTDQIQRAKAARLGKAIGE